MNVDKAVITTYLNTKPEEIECLSDHDNPNLKDQILAVQSLYELYSKVGSEDEFIDWVLNKNAFLLYKSPFECVLAGQTEKIVRFLQARISKNILIT